MPRKPSMLARHHGDRTVRQTSQFAKQFNDARLHLHAIWRGREFDERAVEIEEKRGLARRQKNWKCLHRVILPFGLVQPEKCAHLTAHPSIFRERKQGRKRPKPA